MHTATESAAKRVLWQEDLARRYNVTRTTIYRWDRDGKLPPVDVVIGRHRGRYVETMDNFDRSTAAAASDAPDLPPAA